MTQAMSKTETRVGRYDVTLWTVDGADCPHCAEVCADNATNVSGYYAEIGLTWDGMTLDGYDGVFALPVELVTVLREKGFEVPEDCEE